MKNEARSAYMDFLKGIAVSATVIGHLVTDIPAGDMLFNAIYSFHMPLLFFVSAYIEEQNRGKYTNKQMNMLLKRATGLLLPYFSWSLLYMVFLDGIPFDLKIENWGAVFFRYEQNGLWFLLVLFGLKIMHFFYWKICKVFSKPKLWKNIMVICLLEGMVVILALFIKQAFIVNMLSYAVPYFFGVVILDSEWTQKMVASEWIVAGAILIYVAVFPLFSFYNTNWTTQFIRIGLSLCVIVICLKLQKLWELSQFNKMICMCGKNSLEIYLLHVFFTGGQTYLERLDSSLAVAVLAVAEAVIIVTICVVIAKLLEISSWWKKILFGK